MSNLCIRCGKERIVIEEWSENIEPERRGSQIRHIKTTCPDPECQKIVDKNLAREKQKNDERRAEKVENERILKEERQKRMEQQILSKQNKRKNKS